MKIVEIREKTLPISSPIRNAYIDFSKMTLSLVAVITDVIRDGKPVVGYGFNSNGRYGQGKLMRERFSSVIVKRIYTLHFSRTIEGVTGGAFEQNGVAREAHCRADPGFKPVAERECQVLLIEPSDVVNTGTAGGERTATVHDL